ncbi:MAG: hypothetical protein K9W45_04410 [Candidatus Heimdallarchaeum aukensis]|uniref:Uncharacterized protein n=1 Tax=Candidatus Heimdallarchaeum aukensis TaxID=2876573 RepID=A0A9Y1FLI5_9ARCH|nr:MAG: hypothetical protein K9W45_04410 [Candidatus Heimdallarchaeum aukensis]
MTPSKFYLSMSILVLDDLGIELRVSSDTKIKQEDIVLIANFYSPIIEASKSEIGVFGPLPVPKYQEKYNLLVVLFEHNDSKIKNKRALSKSGLARCLGLIIYEKKYTEKINLAHSSIFVTIQNFFKKVDDLSSLTENQVAELSNDIINTIREKEKNVKLKNIDEYISELSNRINMLEMLATTLQKRYKIGFFTDDEFAYKLIISAIFAIQNIDLVLSYSVSEWIIQIQTCNGEYYISRLYDLETLADISEIKDLNYVIYQGRCDLDKSQIKRHFRNIDRINKQNKDTQIIFTTTNEASTIPINVKKILLEEEKQRENVLLLVTIGDIYRSLENTLFKIVNDLLEKREMQIQENYE